MNQDGVRPSRDGRLLWTFCALLFSIGFVLMLGIGTILMLIALAWAAYLAYMRTPGYVYAIGTLGVSACLLVLAWIMF